ncbi:hypothetical protein AMTRI_Chr13g125070 [Amborella trichopoda]
MAAIRSPVSILLIVFIVVAALSSEVKLGWSRGINGNGNGNGVEGVGDEKELYCFRVGRCHSWCSHLELCFHSREECQHQCPPSQELF